MLPHTVLHELESLPATAILATCQKIVRCVACGGNATVHPRASVINRDIPSIARVKQEYCARARARATIFCFEKRDMEEV